MARFILLRHDQNSTNPVLTWLPTVPAWVMFAQMNSTEQQGQPPAPTWKKRIGIQQKVQAATLQRLLYDAALSLKQSCTKDGVLIVSRDEATALAQLVRSWDVARDALRVLRGKGLPASVRSKAGRSTPQTQPLEPA